jgi:hypothetical protein
MSDDLPVLCGRRRAVDARSDETVDGQKADCALTSSRPEC